MTDWARPMRQEVSFFEVDPRTFRDVRRMDEVLSCTVTRDSGSDTLESAVLSFDRLFLGEMWVRCYLTATQDGASERHPMGTWLVQTPSRTLDGRASEVSAAAYSVLHPLREAMPPVGWSLPVGANCAEHAAACCSNGPAPVVGSPAAVLLSEPYVAPLDASWLSTASALAAPAGMQVAFDRMGTVHVVPKSPARSLAHVWEFADDGSSVLLPDATESDDWYGTYNVVTVVCGGVVGRAVNDDPASPASTVSRGREVELRVEDPDELKAGCTQEEADMAARLRLQEESAKERTITISHGYCPVSLGDCVRVSYRSLGLEGDAVVTRQVIELAVGVTVETTAVAVRRLWGGA